MRQRCCWNARRGHLIGQIAGATTEEREGLPNLNCNNLPCQHAPHCFTPSAYLRNILERPLDADVCNLPPNCIYTFGFFLSPLTRCFQFLSFLCPRTLCLRHCGGGHFARLHRKCECVLRGVHKSVGCAMLAAHGMIRKRQSCGVHGTQDHNMPVATDGTAYILLLARKLTASTTQLHLSCRVIMVASNSPKPRQLGRSFDQGWGVIMLSSELLLLPHNASSALHNGRVLSCDTCTHLPLRCVCRLPRANLMRSP